MGAGFDYAKAYEDYGAGKYSDADFERYVDSKGDLSGAWDLVNTYRQKGDMSKFPMHGNMTPEQQAEYWINRGATSKAAFGRSHAAEDAALYGGTYSGGRSGRTDIMPGTQAYEDYFGGREGTRFEEAMGGLLNNGSLGRERTDSALGAAAADASMTAPPFYHTGGGSPGDRNYPILPSAPYEAPGLLAGLPASYSPWVQPSNIPDSLWNYQPPELVDWDMSNRVPWDWANRPISDFVASRERTGNRSDGVNDGNQGDPLYERDWREKQIARAKSMDDMANAGELDRYGFIPTKATHVTGSSFNLPTGSYSPSQDIEGAITAEDMAERSGLIDL